MLSAISYSFPFVAAQMITQQDLRNRAKFFTETVRMVAYFLSCTFNILVNKTNRELPDNALKFSQTV